MTRLVLVDAGLLERAANIAEAHEYSGDGRAFKAAASGPALVQSHWTCSVHLFVRGLAARRCRVMGEQYCNLPLRRVWMEEEP